MTVDFVYDDGGRMAAGFRGDAGDCVTRAIAIATGLPYRGIYDMLNERAGKAVACTGVARKVYARLLADLGWEWTPTMQIGSGCRVHLRVDELPQGRVIVRLSKHVASVIDGELHDTHDCSREGTRCVYGYWTLSR